MAIPGFFYHPRSMTYDFGPRHPLRPIRLERTMALLQAVAPDFEAIDPGLCSREDVERVHSSAYVDVVQAFSNGHTVARDLAAETGFLSGDNPPFAGMYEASLAYCAGAVRAAEMVRDGGPLAFNISGGLHHAQVSHASGFCIFNDPAIACSILREKFDRVAYVDIDLHHGDGVENFFYEDSTVLTYSIHQSGKTLYPGTGFEWDSGLDFTSINMPLPSRTTGEVWFKGFAETIRPAFERFRPQAVVLQMGSDPHWLDPLGHLECRVEDWLAAVKWVRDWGVPIVAMGGGGYCMTTVPRMWVAAVLTLSGIPVPEAIPEEIPADWGMTTFLDGVDQPRVGEDEVDRLIEFWKASLT